VIGRGRLIADVSVAEFTRAAAREAVHVRTPDAGRLRELLTAPDVVITVPQADLLEVQGMTTEQIGDLACRDGMTVYEMTPQRASLEEAFMALTRNAVEFDAGQVTS